jgi:hypothetical protein
VIRSNFWLIWACLITDPGRKNSHSQVVGRFGAHGPENPKAPRVPVSGCAGHAGVWVGLGCFPSPPDIQGRSPQSIFVFSFFPHLVTARRPVRRGGCVQRDLFACGVFPCTLGVSPALWIRPQRPSWPTHAPVLSLRSPTPICTPPVRAVACPPRVPRPPRHR